MRRPRRFLLVMMPFFLLMGVTNSLKFSEKLMEASDNVRVVHIIGLAAGGAMCGAAFTGFMVALLSKKRFEDELTVAPAPSSQSLSRDLPVA